MYFLCIDSICVTSFLTLHPIGIYWNQQIQFEGDGSSSDEWRDYGRAGDDYNGPPVFDDDQYKEESMPVYDTDIKNVIKEEEGFAGKGGFEGAPLRVLKLQDTGNAVLIDVASGTTLWQSFNAPTDTFLPGMMMAGDLKLTSWKNIDDPGSGSFEFQPDPGTNSCMAGFERISPVDTSAGCKRTSEICQRSPKDTFLKVTKISMDDTTLPLHPAKKESECIEKCLENCQCLAYSFRSPNGGGKWDEGRDGKQGCWFWNSEPDNLKENGSHDISFRISESSKDPEPRFTTPSAIPKPENKSSSRGRVFAFAIAGSALILSSLCGISYCLYKKLGNRRKINQQSLEIQSSNMRRRMNELLHLDHSKEDDREGIDVPYFELESIMVATDDFAEKNRLGQGGFGPVYKGILPGGQEIAVKRLSSLSGQGLQEFKNEVILIAKLQHRNLVRLLGYCISGDEKMLLYEFLRNRSLDLFIFDPTLCTSLDWAMRFNIIMGIARGLHYLHHDSRIVHGNDMEAVTNRVVGTFGYMSPEYALDGLFSIKSDVFSFGVVMLEIISGKRNTGFYQSQKSISLLGYVWSLWTEDKPFELMDQIPIASCNSSEVLKCITVGLLCVQGDPDDRPTMTNVVLMLGGDIVTLPTPKEPAFITRRDHVISSSSSSSKPDTLTNNMLTITEFEGR
nr:G-type lectin S-receptor-like serine/threonine-protein kinase At4g03230 [Tanacetum cinerariifolium]